ncbi:MAG: hypothetical protein H6Q70_3955 [Firmicutes bacterium]|nr:hypothetical protein [Bacillota bacterium]
MATVGDQLTAPEGGWKRYDDTDTHIAYSGTWTYNTYSGSYNTSEHITKVLNDSCSFKFYGSKLRIIGVYNSNCSKTINVNIDGVSYSYSAYASSLIRQTINFEKTDLSLEVHTVTVTNEVSGSYATLDAIDIDDSGYLGSITAPTNLTATAGDSQVTLSWTAVDEATSYTVKRSTTSGGTYTTIASDITDTSYVDTTVTNGTTYYYVVTAVNDYGESENSNEASATPVDSSKVLLVITMSEEVQKEYELSKIELDAFIDWYNTRAEGTGLAYYIFNKDFNLGPFDSRKDYIVFDKIENFEVMQFTK